jgi:protein-tyrosine phosphatase
MAKPKSPILSNVVIERVNKDKYKISWETEGKDVNFNVFACDSPQTIDHNSPIVNVRGATFAEITGLDPDVRNYFEIVPEGGKGVIVAERHVNFDRIVNFRDLGGYETADGQRVKWGQVFRSGHLARATEKDRSLLRRMGIKLICDFRTPGEIKAQPDWLPEDGSIKYLQMPIVHGEFDPVAAMQSLQKGDISWLTEDFMIDRYIKKIDDFPEIWCEFFQHLSDPQNRPLVFHCTAGKDRAGACAALVLLALGVPEKTVIYDHGLSNIYIADALKMINERITAMGIDPEKVAPYFTAPRNAIVAFVEHIRKTYGSADNYLMNKASVSKNSLELLKRELLD